MKTESKIAPGDLGIDLKRRNEEDLFKWFLACLLFGKPIQQEVAKQTYYEFVSQDLTSPQSILDAGWDRLVEVLDEGHYVRFDFSTATKLLDVCQNLIDRYGSVTDLLTTADSHAEIVSRLLAFKGVGPVTVRIFTDELEGI